MQKQYLFKCCSLFFCRAGKSTAQGQSVDATGKNVHPFFSHTNIENQEQARLELHVLSVNFYC